jgi:hypothetical protein
VLQVSQFLVELVKRRHDLNDVTEAAIKDIFQSLNSDEPIDDVLKRKTLPFEEDKSFSEKITREYDALRRLRPGIGGGISDAERVQIVKALGAQVATWYKCSQGLFFEGPQIEI